MDEREVFEPGEVTLRRAFGWGVFFIGDSQADIVEVLPGAPVLWGDGREAAAVLVRHAQDVDDDVLDALGPDDDVPDVAVTVVVRWGFLAPRPVDAEGWLDVPSGRLTLGDADFEDIFELRPGKWRVQVLLDRPPDPERVDIWISAAPGAA